MKRTMIAALVLLLPGGTEGLRGQTAQVPSWSFSAGFSRQAGPTMNVAGHVGDAAVGRSTGSGKVVLSGFIPGAARTGGTAVLTQNHAMQDKWNMVSVPLTLADYAKTAVYPTAVSNAFAYTGLYTSAPVLSNGPGYWVKFDGAQGVPMTGLVREVDSFAVGQGWNMVGSVSSPMNAADVTSDPPGLVTSSFFRFDNLYVASATIEPGRAYWVKLTAPGTLILNASAAAPKAGRIRIVPDDELPPPPPDGELAEAVPEAYALEQNFPNPFNPVTEIRYALPAAGVVRLAVFNILGQEVAVLRAGYEEAGFRSVSFDASPLPSGVYAYRLTAGSYTAVRRMLLLK